MPVANKGSIKSQKLLRLRIGSNLRAARTKNNWTQEEASFRYGIHFRHYQKLEYGRTNVTIDTLAKICDGLKVDILELFKK